MEKTIDLSFFGLGIVPYDPLSVAAGVATGLLFGAVMLFLAMRKRKTLINRIDTLLEANNELEKDIIRLETEKESLAQTGKQFEAQFENLAHRIFDEKTKTFKAQSKENLDGILSPLKEKLSDFEKKVSDSFVKQAKEQFSLTEQIKVIVEAKNQLSLQAEGLTNALKGDSKVQGDWGEVMLEKILDDVGLRKGEDYIVQGSGMGLKHGSGSSQKPDVIVNLPENKHVIIDSKVTLTAYERFFNEREDKAVRAGHLKAHLEAVKKRVKELEARRYQDTEGLGTPDFVLMFIPIESAYMLALQEDRSLHEFAWNKGVAIVCPSTLFSSLSTIASLWKLARQNQNAEEIARKGGALYDKMVGFVNDMQSIGKNIKTLEGSYDSAMNKLSEGRGNLLRQTENLKEMGAKTSKSLPVALIKKDDEAA
jgi:DNA recombination protein RmuC